MEPNNCNETKRTQEEEEVRMVRWKGAGPHLAVDDPRGVFGSGANHIAHKVRVVWLGVPEALLPLRPGVLPRKRKPGV